MGQLTVQDIVNGVSTDVRQMLGTSGADATVINDWVDRVQKDCLRDSVYRNLNRAYTMVTTVSGTAIYTLTPTTIRQVISVYDRTTDRWLTSYESMMALANSTTPYVAQEALSLSTRTSLPEVYKFVAPQTLVVYPAPLAGLCLEVGYEGLVASVNGSLTAVLVIPDDGRDMMTAGVNYLANTWLQREQAAQFWLQLYMKLKSGRPLTDSGPLAPPPAPPPQT